MSTTLTTTGLKIVNTYGDGTWASIYNYNWQRMNDTLLKMASLVDVVSTGIAAGDVIVWSASLGKFVKYTPSVAATLLTTTTTTTTTSSSTSTTTTTTAP